MKTCMMWAASLLAAWAGAATDFDAAENLLPYAYSVDRPGTEKGYGALNDGKRATGISWHNRWTQMTDIICELRETCEIDDVEIHMPKPSKWYLVYEVQVAFDTGLGDFGDPVRIPGFASNYAKMAGNSDASCTNHVLRVKKPGRAVRMRVRVKSDAYATVSEIRLLGRPVPVEDPTGDVPKGATRTLENAQWRLTFSPIGGRVLRAYSKAFGFDLTDGAGSFTEAVWDRPKSHGFLLRKPYDMTYGSGKGGKLRATAVGLAEGGGIDFLRIGKTYRSANDSTALRVDYRFENTPAAMALQHYAPLVSAAVGAKGQPLTLYVPTLKGILAVAATQAGREFWEHHPARGWLAAVAPDGTGAAITLPYKDVRAFYSRFGTTPTLDWRMIPVALNEGEDYKVTTEILPFKGLKTIAGAGGGLVGELAGGVCRVVSACAGEVTAEAGDQVETLTFDKPGASVSFKTTATTVTLRRDGRVICRLEAPPATGAWTLAPEGPRRETTVEEIDLCRYTNFPRQENAPKWGRPLPGKRLKVGVITGMGNLLEIARLQDRFDFEFTSIGAGLAGGYPKKRAFHNPVFSDGDSFSLVGIPDLERGIAKVLAYDADVLLVGGIPFEVLKPELQAKLIEKVKGGTGLVWIGQDRDVPELDFHLLDKGRAVSHVPKAVGDVFASVPFALLGAEPAFAIDAAKGTVHATAGGDRPYLVESTLGQGRVFNLAYNATTGAPWPVSGITPAGLTDFYETRIAPVEDYYSLVAKALLAAAKRTLPVSFGAVQVTGDSASLALNAQVPGHVVLRWSAEDAFGRTLASGKVEKALQKGGNAVTLAGLGIPPAQGPLAFRLVVTTRKGGVLNWGAWAFAHAPKAEITALKPEAKWKREGETLNFSAEAKGDTAGLSFVFDLVDSYARMLATKTMPAGAKVTASFPVEDALLSRSFTLEARLVEASGRLLARRHTEIRVRPRSEKLAWDDFEVGIWASNYNREYFWPEMGALFHRLGISTLIANPWRIENDFAMRYNIHPTLLSSSGLTRSSDISEYARTGDKMTLARPSCLSTPKFYAGCDREIENMRENILHNAYRFVWFGDEMCLTSNGGGAIDYCFSPDCLREMRTAMKAKYGSLERLNAEWETAFKTWDAVVPFTREEVWAQKGRHVAGWSDHLEFMDNRLTNAVSYMVRNMRASDGDVRFALSGTQAPSAYGGMDWGKVLKVLDAGLTYGGGGQHDIHRALRPDGGYMPWSWGYAQKGGAAINNVWNSVFYGCRGLMGFQQTSQINRDWTYSRGLKDTLPAIRRMVEGTGRHFVSNLRVPHEVAVLYAQASFRAAFIEERTDEHRAIEELVRQLLVHGGLAYDYVTCEDLATGVVAQRGYRALVLPDAAALSDAEIAAITAFGQKGTVIAFGRLAERQANCRPREKGALDALFKGGRHTRIATPDVGYVKAAEFPNQSENAAIVQRGRAMLAKALAPSGLEFARLGVANAETGRDVLNVAVRPKVDAAGHFVWCALGGPSAPVDTRFTFKEKRWIYDLVTGRAHGETQVLTLPFGVGQPHAFACFPTKVDLAVPTVTGTTLNLAYTAPVDGVVRVRLYRPDGGEAECYAKNVPIQSGRGAYTVPFALSDPRGQWKVVAESIFGRASQTVEMANWPNDG